MDVILKGVPTQYIKLIKSIRHATGLDLRESKRLVDDLNRYAEVSISLSHKSLDPFIEEVEALGVRVVSIEGDEQLAGGVRQRAREMGLEDVLAVPGVIGPLYDYFRRQDEQEKMS